MERAQFTIANKPHAACGAGRFDVCKGPCCSGVGNFMMYANSTCCSGAGLKTADMKAAAPEAGPYPTTLLNPFVTVLPTTHLPCAGGIHSTRR